MAVLRIAACQIDSVMGDLDGNVGRLVSVLTDADRAGCDLAVVPELAVPGYPPEDLVLKPGFVDDNRAALEALVASTRDLGCVCVVGFVDRIAAAPVSPPRTAPLLPPRIAMSGAGEDHTGLLNAAAVMYRGECRGVYAKHLLPNYAVFDEKRYFDPGPLHQAHYVVGGVDVAVLICEDLWEPEPAAAAKADGAQLVVALNGSPYYRGRLAERTAVMAQRAGEAGCPILYVNLVGGQDELVFDGASMLVGRDGTVLARSPQFREDLLVAEMEPEAAASAPDASAARVPPIEISAVPRDHLPVELRPPAPQLAPTEEVYEALVVGTRDYIVKSGFSGALVAMSGGIDSSIVACIAADAIGSENVHGVAMPSRYSSPGSLVDAEEVAKRLGIDFRVVPIEPAHEAFLAMLHAGGSIDLAQENLQSRIRGVVIMYLSNANGWIVLTTGNKSELAVGYSTLYGDTAGGFAVIKDVPKTLVYALCRFRNQAGEDQPDRYRGGGAGGVIPESVLTKPPSAELRPDQRDDQSLPPYEVLDPILEHYVEGDETVAGLIARGVDPPLAVRVAHLVDVAEYKRRQGPPGVRVTPKAFGKDRRMPITNRYFGRDGNR